MGLFSQLPSKALFKGFHSELYDDPFTIPGCCVLLMIKYMCHVTLSMGYKEVSLLENYSLILNQEPVNQM